MAGPSTVEQVDLKVAEAVAPSRKNLVVLMLGQASELADQPPLIALTAGTMLLGLFTRNAGLANLGGRMLAAELVGTALKSAVKHRVNRTRPFAVHEGSAYAMEAGDSDASADTSFPSGHTAGAVAVARAIVRTYPGQAVTAYGIAAAVAVIQIPRCKHYPSDLLAGAVVGVAADWMVGASERALVGWLRRFD